MISRATLHAYKAGLVYGGDESYVYSGVAVCSWQGI